MLYDFINGQEIINFIENSKNIDEVKDLFYKLLEDRNELFEVLEELADEKEVCVTYFIDCRGKC